MNDLVKKWRDLTLMRRIELGGMTDLHVVLTPEYKRLVLKRLKKEYCQNSRIRKQFLTGSTILGKMNHPSIIGFVEGGIDEDRTPYLLLEYFESKNVRQLIHSGDPILQSHFRLILLQFAEAINYIHQAGYVHFDLKPENILVNQYGDLRIVDFDLSMKWKKKPGRIREISGTPAYIGPEVLAFKQFTELTDIFSFGVVSFEILTGHKPPAAGVKPDPARTSQIQADLLTAGTHPALARIIFKCLDPDPSARYPAMALALMDLKKVI
jgi:serine/threonine protein kinase